MVIPKQFFILFVIVLLVFNHQGRAQELVQFKQVDTTKLYMEVYSPPQMQEDSLYPAMVFFFGGGWIGGDRHHFLNHAKYFSERGLVCFLPDYRIKSKHGTTPFESLKDAKSAMRFIRENASQFNVDPNRIIASGGSAGGHLAAAMATIDKFNDEKSDVVTMPCALVLFNPVIDNGPGGYGFDRIKEDYKDFSPLHNLHKDVPPTIFFLGTEDKLIPVETAKYFEVVLEKLGVKCDLHLYEGAGHGFFNYGNSAFYMNTVKKTDLFLQDLGYLKSKPVFE